MNHPHANHNSHHKNDHGHHQKHHVVSTLLQWTYGLLFIVAGADKFLNLITQWAMYAGPYVLKLADAMTIMKVAGVIEIIVGLLILWKPRIGALIATIWLLLVAMNLITMGMYYDIAVRDIVIAIGALALYLMRTHCEEEMKK